MSVAEQVIESIEAVGGLLAVRGKRIRCRLPEDAAHLLDELREHKDEVLDLLKRRDSLSVPEMPPGVKLIEWNPKRPPVALSSIAIVNDVDRYIERTLRLLGLALAAGAQPDERRVRDLTDKLEQCGVLVEIDGQ